MTPILGVIDSAKSGNLATPGFNFFAVADPSGVNSFTFSGIPQGYTDLQIRGIAKSNRTTLNCQPLRLRFNNDSTSGNYGYSWVRGYNSGNDSIQSFNTQSLGYLGQMIVSSNATAGTNTAGSIIIDIQQYSSASARKVVRYRSGGVYRGMTSSNTDFQVAVGGAYWNSTSAITSITIICEGAQNFVYPSHFALYGIKASS